MDNKQIRNRYLALFLAFVMLIGILPTNIFAQDPTPGTQKAGEAIESQVSNDANNAIHAYVGIQVGGDLNMKLEGDALNQQFKPIAGVRAYFQWFEKGGYASPVYTAVSDAQGRLNIGCKPFLASDGKIIKFDADTTSSGGTEKYRFWIDDKNLPDSLKDHQLQYITGENVVFPSDELWVTQGGATTDVVPNTISTMKILFMEKPKAIMHKANPTVTPALRTGLGAGGTVWGKVTWDYESPSGGVQWGMVATPSSKAPGVKIKASYLSDYALKQIYGPENVARMNLKSAKDIRGSKWSYALETQLQDWIQEQVKKDPNNWIAETVTTKPEGTNADGDYKIQFNGTWGPARNGDVYDYKIPNLWPQYKKDRVGTVAASPNDGSFAAGLGQDTKHINIDWMFISADDTEDLRLMTPFNNNWFTGTSGLTGNWGIHSGWAQSAFGVTTALDTNNNIRADFGFGSPGVNFNITNYDSGAHTALPGDIAQTSTTGLPYKNSSDNFVIVWYGPDGKEVGKGTSQKPTGTGTIDSAPLDTSKLNITETTEYTAKLYRVKPDGSLEAQPIAADSFTVEVSHLCISRYDDVSIVNPKASDKEMKGAKYYATGLPQDLTMTEADGTIKGKAKEAGLYKVNFRTVLPDPSGNIEGTRARYIAVTDSPLKAGEVGVAYSQDVKPIPATDPNGRAYIYKMKSVNFISGKEIAGLKVEGDADTGFKITGTPTAKVEATEDVLNGDPGPNVEVTYDIYKKNDAGKEVLVKANHKDKVPLVVRPIVIIPDQDNPGKTPEGYARVTFAPGTDGAFGANDKKVFDVLKGKTIQEAQAANPALTIPTVTANDAKKEHTAWTADKDYATDLKDYTTALNADVKFTAKYEDKKVVIIPKDPSNPGDTPEGYHKVTFDATTNGKINGKQTYSAFVLDGKTIQEAQKADPKLTIPTVTANDAEKEHTAWTADKDYATDLKDYKTALNGNVDFTAKYTDKAAPATDADKLTPVYADKDGKAGTPATTDAPTFTDADGKATTAPNGTKYKLGDKAPEGATIDENTGKVTYTPKESEAGKPVEIPVVVTYPDKSTDNAKAKINVAKLDDVIDRTNNPNATTPDGYHRVTFVAGEGVEALTNPPVYDVKDGVALTADKYPTATAKSGYENPVWSTPAGTAITANNATITATATEIGKTATPIITAPKAGDKKISGTSEPNAKVVVELPDGTKIETTADGEGKWTANVPEGKELTEGQTVKAKATVTGKTESKEGSATVGKAEEQTATPKITAPKAGDKTITGTSEPNAKVVVELPDGTKVETTADGEGKWTANVPEGKELTEGQTVKAKATVTGKTESKEGSATVGKADETPTGKTTVKYPNTEIGKGSSTVVTPEVKDKDGQPVEPSKVGTPTVTNTDDLPNGLTVTPKENGKVEVTVPKDYDGPNTLQIKVKVPVDGKDVESIITVIVKEKGSPEPLPIPDNYLRWPIYFAPTKTEVKPAPVLERHESYINGYPDGTVRPDGKITRAEVSAIFARLTQKNTLAQFVAQYSDVKINDWFTDSIMKLSSKGILTGYPDGTFKPNRSITRAEFANIVSKYIKNPKSANETFTDVPMNHWAKNAIAMVKAEGWITGYPDGTFRPDAPITRAEAVSIVNRMFDRAADTNFVSVHDYEIKSYTDLNGSHWAYYEIMEATQTHNYEKLGVRVERWDNLVK